MQKSIRNLALTAALMLTAAPMFANIMGPQPHPQGNVLSFSDYASIALTFFGM